MELQLFRQVLLLTLDYNKYMNCYYYSSTYGNSTYPGNLIMTFTKQGTVQIVWGNGYNSSNSNNIVSLYLNDVLKEQAITPAQNNSKYQIISTYNVNVGDVLKLEEYYSLILLYEMAFEVEPDYAHYWNFSVNLSNISEIDDEIDTGIEADLFNFNSTTVDNGATQW